MATVAVSFSSACAGGGHLLLGVAVNGGAGQTIEYTVDEIQQAEPADLIHDFVLAVLRLHFGGMTRAQIRSALQAGFTVTI